MSAAAGAWGFAGDVFTSIMGYRAQKKYLDWLKKFYGPELAAKNAALPAIQNLVLGYYLPQVGKQSELLKSQHLLNLAGLGRQEARALGGSERYWGLRGNTGRGRGEQLRIRMAGQQLRNLENLGYGQSQEQYLSGKAAQALTGLQMLATLGHEFKRGVLERYWTGTSATAGLRGPAGAVENHRGVQPCAAVCRCACRRRRGRARKRSADHDAGPVMSGYGGRVENTAPRRMR
jgi:hypothetical protein